MCRNAAEVLGKSVFGPGNKIGISRSAWRFTALISCFWDSVEFVDIK